MESYGQPKCRNATGLKSKNLHPIRAKHVNEPKSMVFTSKR